MDVRTLKLKNEREGKFYENSYGEKFLVLEYSDYYNVKVRFENGYERIICWQQIEFKNCITPYTKTVCNIGYLGEGKYNPNDYKKIYKIWKAMIERCYKDFKRGVSPTYENCFIEDYLLNFQNYAEWYINNSYDCNGEEMELDKDILEKGNKMYDREHMIFVPKRINQLFNKRQNCRGEYPIGVYLRKATTKNRRKEDVLTVQCNIIDVNGNIKKKHLGYFPLNRPFQAFYTYKTFKENYIKQVADEYKDIIPQKLYEALYKYEVEIND